MINQYDLTILQDFDWKEAFEYASFPIKDVTEIFAASEGENDGPPWLMVGSLKDGRFFYLEASCDYTGWSCVAHGSSEEHHDAQELWLFHVPKHYRNRLYKNLSPKGQEILLS